MSTQQPIENPNIKTWKGLLHSGVPTLTVLHLAQGHAKALNELSGEVEGRDQALKEVEAFISEIKEGKYD